MVIIITIRISFDTVTISNFHHVLIDKCIQKQFQAILWRPHWVRCWSGERFLFTFSHFISRFHQTGKRCSWTRCPGFVLLDVFNLERTKVVFHDVLTNIIIHCIIFFIISSTWNVPQNLYMMLPFNQYCVRKGRLKRVKLWWKSQISNLQQYS